MIGFLVVGSKAAGARYYDGFPQGMQELGYFEARDYAFEGRYADGDTGRLPMLAEEVVRLKPDVLLASPISAAMVAKRATDAIPIVCPALTDPVGVGLVVSEARPGTNVTGLLSRVEGLPGKQVEIARDVIPGASTIGLLMNVASRSNSVQRRGIEAAAAKLGMSIVPVEIRTPEEIGQAFQSFVAARANVVIVAGDAMFVSARRQIAAVALVSRLPTVFPFREHVEDGGLISYGIDLRANYSRAAYFVDRILKGEKPADLPIEFPNKVELVVNLATAKALGVVLSPILLARADEVIE